MSNTDFGAAYEAGKEAAALHEIQRVNEFTKPFVVVDADERVMPLEEQLERPRRIEEKRQFGDVAGFAQYVNRFKSEPTSLFAKRDGALIWAELDYHAPDAPSHNTHRASLPLRLSEEFQAWQSCCGVKLGQERLALLLDERIDDIRSPDAGSVLTAVSEFNLRRTAVFKAALDLHSDRVQLAYEERDDAKGSGTIVVPTEFTLGIPVYEGGAPWEVKVRLKYGFTDSDNGKKLYFALTIQRLQTLMTNAFRAELKRAEEAVGLTAMLVV